MFIFLIKIFDAKTWLLLQDCPFIKVVWQLFYLKSKKITCLKINTNMCHGTKSHLYSTKHNLRVSDSFWKQILGTHIFWNNESHHKNNESQDQVLHINPGRTFSYFRTVVVWPFCFLLYIQSNLLMRPRVLSDFCL